MNDNSNVAHMNDNANAAQPDADPEAKAPEALPAAPDPFAVVEALNKENGELKDRLLRALAEMENLRRRTEREVADARLYGVTNFARDMIGLADNLQRAIDNVPVEARAAAEGSFKTLIEGVELSARDFVAAMGRHGVRKIDPKGEKFDPNLHQAMFEAPDETIPTGTVMQVMQSGWTIGDRVVRPALVGVSKGGPKAAPKVEAANS